MWTYLGSLQWSYSLDLCTLVLDSTNRRWNCPTLLDLTQLRSICVFNETPCYITLLSSLAVLKMQDAFIFMLS